MTTSNPENIIVRHIGPESLATPKGRTKAEAMVACIKTSAPSATCTIRDDAEAVETSAGGVTVAEAISTADASVKPGDWYVAHSDPQASNLPPSP